MTEILLADMSKFIDYLNSHENSTKNILLKLDINKPISEFIFSKPLKGYS